MMKRKGDVESRFFEVSTKGNSTQVFGCEGVDKYVNLDRKRIRFLLLLMGILFTSMLSHPKLSFRTS